MCRQRQAADERHKAAVSLFQTVQSSLGSEGFGIGPSLGRVFRPVPLDPAWNDILSRIDDKEGSS